MGQLAVPSAGFPCCPALTLLHRGQRNTPWHETHPGDRLTRPGTRLLRAHLNPKI